MDEDWRNTFGILMLPLGAGPGGVAPKGPKSIFKNIMSHVAYQIKDNEKENTVVQKFCPGDMTGGH